MKDKTNAEIDECGSGVGIGTWSYFAHSADRLFISSVLTGEIATVDNDLDNDLDEDGRRMYYPPIGHTFNHAFFHCSCSVSPTLLRILVLATTSKTLINLSRDR